ncbi:MAG TPA: HAD-IB family hydrolase, partial [Deltaproteobacteria bacterium]|nr:HAD-IB family hydrolase [Deltaproteobacteria bacterium]
LEENLNLRGDLAEEIWFYTDSQNDLPLLERSDHPIVVEPDDRLREIAQNSGWKIIM